MQLQDLRSYLDEFLHIDALPDYANALNGLQVENSGEVNRIAAAVDASSVSIERAALAGADLLLVHHGLFWDGNQPVTGRRFRRLRALLNADLAVYSAHLPLDVHPEVGNNAVLARRLGVEARGNFGEFKGEPLGVWGMVDLHRGELAGQLEEILGQPPKLVPGGPERIRRLGIVTGGAGDLIHAALETGLDAFVTGEGAHHHFFDAEEGGINLFFAGHYATETWGVRALAEHLEARWGLPWSWIDHPTGL